MTATKNGCSDLRIIEQLQIRILEARDLPIRHVISGDKNIFCLVKLDRDELFHSSAAPKSVNPFFGDDCLVEVPRNFRQLHFYLCDQYAGPVPRPFARVSFRKSDIVHNSGVDQWHTLKPYSRHSDITGKICLEVSYEECLDGSDTVAQRVKLKVLDVSDLCLASSSSRSVDLYALVTLQIGPQRLSTNKLKIPARKHRNEAETPSHLSTPSLSSLDSQHPPCLSIDLDTAGERGSLLDNPFGGGSSPESTPERGSPDMQLRISLWHDLLRGFNSYFHGELRVPLDRDSLTCGRPNTAWYYLKPRNSSGSSAQSSSSGSSLGSLRLKMTYKVDHVLPAVNYQELFSLVLESLGAPPVGEMGLSPCGVLGLLPGVGLEEVSRPLVKIFLQADCLRPLIRLLAAQEISLCPDVNTLFRSSSLASKVLYEAMKLIGHQYLLVTLKPCIDKIFLERKCCEIDPVKIDSNQRLEENTHNLFVYAEQTICRVVDSNHRCPQLLKEIFSDLREITHQFYPGRMDVQRLVLSSFIVMRFFSAAILNPKLFGIKRENPEPKVARTLALISKTLQKLSNVVVCGRELCSKEPWQDVILERLTDERHKMAMEKLLDRISCMGGENSISGDSVSLLREGMLVERIPRQKRCLEFSWLTARRRLCRLTETELYWGKNSNDMSKGGRVNLSEVTRVEAVEESRFSSKHVFLVASDNALVFFQAPTSSDLTDWVCAIERQCRRQRLAARQQATVSQLYDIDTDRELESIHFCFLEHAETLRQWNGLLEGTILVPSVCLPFELEGVLYGSAGSSGKRVSQLQETLRKILSCTFTLEQKHREAAHRFLRQIKYGSKDNPIGDENYLLLKSRMKDLAVEPTTSSS